MVAVISAWVNSHRRSRSIISRRSHLKSLGENYSEEAVIRRILKQQCSERRLVPIQPAVRHIQYKGNFNRHKSIKGFRALYLHYLYLLRKAQRQPTQRVSFLLREDIRKMDAFVAQTKLLCKYRIDTKEQLMGFIESREAKKAQLIDDRKTLGNRIRWAAGKDIQMDYRQQTGAITNSLSVIRAELKAANGILSRSEEIKEKRALVHKNQRIKDTSHKMPARFVSSDSHENR